MTHKTCDTCRHLNLSVDDFPCNVCSLSEGIKWESPNPSPLIKRAEQINQRLHRDSPDLARELIHTNNLIVELIKEMQGG